MLRRRPPQSDAAAALGPDASAGVGNADRIRARRGTVEPFGA
jgi:hypothetical protein